MPKGLKGWVESFRTGKHPGKGELAKHTFTKDDLDQIVANLTAPVPHTITHEKMYSPFAYAHGVEAKRDGDVLLLRSDNINTDFEKLIKTGALYERSVGIVKDAVKGFMLDHIAWLGAEPPAVEGLAPVQFAKSSAFTVFSSKCAVDKKGDFSFIDTSTPYSLKRLARSIREWIVDKDGKETADSVIPEHMIESMEWNEDRARDESKKQAEKDPAERSIFIKKGAPTVPDITVEDLENAKKQAAADAKAAAIAEFKTQQDQQKADFEAKRVEDEWQEIAKELIGDGVLKPAQAEGMAQFAAKLSRDADKVEFSRKATTKGAQDETVTAPKLEWFADFVNGLKGKKQVAMAKHIGGGNSNADGALDIADPDAIEEKIAEYTAKKAAQGIVVTAGEAVSALGLDQLTPD